MACVLQIQGLDKLFLVSSEEVNNRISRIRIAGLHPSDTEWVIILEANQHHMQVISWLRWSN